MRGAFFAPPTPPKTEFMLSNAPQTYSVKRVRSLIPVGLYIEKIEFSFTFTKF